MKHRMDANSSWTPRWLSGCRAGCVGLCAVAIIACSPAPACRVDPRFVDERIGNAQCVIVDQGRVLAARHRASGRYDLPGGRGSASETAQCTAHRETWEEIGLNVIVRRPLTGYGTSWLYECSVALESTQTPVVPFRSKLELAGLEWVDPSQQQPGEWRFPTQLRTIRRLLPD